MIQIIGLIVVVLLVVFIVKNWLAILIAIGAAIALLFAYLLLSDWRDAREVKKVKARAEEKKLITRLTNQNKAFLDGQDRGIYGIYPPTNLDE